MLKRDHLLRVSTTSYGLIVRDQPERAAGGSREQVRPVTGVCACQALIDAAIVEEADAIFVHHGYFWKNEDQRVVA